ncbi:MAG: 1-pyrroline-5-carboxylate dehydrogenase, partial [Marinilabiliales bacterium]
MNNTIFKFEIPENEQVKRYLPNSKESKEILKLIQELEGKVEEIPVIINGQEFYTGNTYDITEPHNHKKLIAKVHMAGEKEIQYAIESALKAKKKWETLSWLERASISLKAAELLSGKYRYLINAVTMISQSKTVHQAEIDAACETIDFLRYNAYFASRIYQDQPRSNVQQLNRLEYRPLEGFVFALSPFNFTSIASNLNMSPVLMGNVTVWKPSTTSVYSNYILMKVFMEAGLPDGVINFIPGKGSE